jgi:hypothetical protein
MKEKERNFFLAKFPFKEIAKNYPLVGGVGGEGYCHRSVF